MTAIDTLLHKAASAPKKPATTPQATAVAPQKTAVAPQATAVAPQKTAVASQATAVAPDAAPGPAAPSSSGKAINSGTEADIQIVDRGGKQYALKVYHPGFHPNTKISNAIKHLGGNGFIADIYEVGKTPEGREYELMEYIPGGSLARYDLKGNATAITTIVLRVAMALDAIHRARIIHKDIKPANILVKDTSIWECVLCDFGIADVMNSDGKAITKQSRTPIYAAPEIYDPACAKAKIDGVDLFEITPAADFYALGMTALCLWSGEQAFRAAEEQMAIDKLTRGVSLPKNMPERLRNIVAGLLKKNPSDRWDLKAIENSLGGHWAVVHTLNPLSDVKLNADPHSKDYAMTGGSIGAFLNKVYMWQFADGKAPADAKICQAIVDSFSDYEGSYMQLFFRSKGNRFKDQDSWMEFCCDWDSDDNSKKAGPQDEDTRLEISMMKTIKGFGFTPYFEFEDDTITFLEDLDKAEAYDKKWGLTHGLKGWLAVQYHENPDADLSEEYAYESLLEDYLLKIGDINPDEDEYRCFCYAEDKAEELEKKVTKIQRKNRTRTVLQTVFGILLVLIPLAFVAYYSFSCINKESRFVYWLVFLPAAIFILVFLFKMLFNRYKYNVTYSRNGANTDAVVSDIIKGRSPDIGYEEELIEPLYYAFSDDKDFDSSINGILYNNIFTDWTTHVKSRGKTLIGHIVVTIVIMILTVMILPKPEILSQTETAEINEQVQ